jgi:serine/threonine protein kinase/tetratricopeptide (TPR) repeat protein
MSGREKAQHILAKALEREIHERGQFIQTACHGDETLRMEVEALLAADTTTDSALTQSIQDPAWPRELLKPGELLAGRFRIVHFVASGGMGDVYEAEDTQLGERIALKTIRTEIAANPRMLARFKKEIQLAKRISHPNVCRIHDLGIDERSSGNMAFLTMELLAGETLAQHLHENRLTLDQVGSMAAQIAAGLDAAHKARIIHRDLKSSNVILIKEDSQLRAVITDFGTAHAGTSERASATLTKTGEIVGTPDYMAPEQVRGEPTSPATDIYALGIMLFEMVTGRLPFTADTPIGAAVKRLQEPPPSPSLYVPKLPKKWENAILRCLEPDPAARFQSAGDLIRFLETERIPARDRALPVLRRHRVSLVILTATSLLIGLAIWISWHGHSRLYITGPPAAAPANSAQDTAKIHYERGLYFWNLRTQDGFLRAIEEYKQATKADPNYALAYSGLASVYAMQSGFKEPKLVFPEANKYAQEAIRLNDKLAPAHAALAFVKFYYDWDWKGAEKEFKKAIELDPGYASAHSNYAVLLSVRSRFDEAREQAKLAEKADPVSAAVATGLGRIYYWSGHYEEAIGQFESVLSMHPQFTEAHLSLASALAAAGNSDAAARHISYVLTQSDALDSSALADLGYMYARTNEKQLARAMLLRLQNLRSERKRYVSPCYPAIVHAALGERDQAFNLLNEGIKERTFEMVYLNINPEYATLRGDRRWQKLVRSVGLVE